MARRVTGGIGTGFEEDGYFDEVGGSNGIASSSFLSPPSSIHVAVNLSPLSAVAVGTGGLSYIVHPVSKLDTLAGVAIKYGVEVSDIRKINGLVSDVQMFARKNLQIPLPGRHPPSPMESSVFDAQGVSSNTKSAPSRRRHSDIFNTFQSLKLSSSSQQDISLCIDNNFEMVDQKPIQEGFETVYRNGVVTRYLQPSNPKPTVGLHRKCKSEANGFMLRDNDLSGQENVKGFRDDDSDKLIKKLHVRRRQKSEVDFSSLVPQISSKEENNNNEINLSATVFKSSCLRPKSMNIEDGQANPVSIGLGDSIIANIVKGIKKSSSTSSFQEPDNGTLFSLWSTSNWSLKPDLDGISNPISGRKNKASVD